MALNGNDLLVRHAVNSVALSAVDSLVLYLGLLIGNWLVYLIHGVPISIHYAMGLIPLWWVFAWGARLVPAWGIGPVEEFRRIQLVLLSLFAMAGMVVFMGPEALHPSRIVYLVSFAFSAVMIPLSRIPVKHLLFKYGIWGCRTAVYGEPNQVGQVIDDLLENPYLGYIPHAVFIDQDVETVGGVPVRGCWRDCCAESSVAIVPVSLGEQLSERGEFDLFFSSYHRVVLVPNLSENIFLWAQPRTLGRVLGLEIQSKLLNPITCAAKRLVEWVCVFIFIPLWVPFCAVIAAVLFCAERRSPFFRQERVGRHGRAVSPLKFQTMVPHAEEVLEEALAQDAVLRAEWEATCKLRKDPRVTSMGRWLRRSSLDELPQLVNVLLGQMSLVGPRPLPSYHHEKLTPSAQTLRLRVLPGMTGLWQVSGRSESGTAGMELWDTFYVRNWSVWLDLIIIARTVLTVFKGTGAY